MITPKDHSPSLISVLLPSLPTCPELRLQVSTSVPVQLPVISQYRQTQPNYPFSLLLRSDTALQILSPNPTDSSCRIAKTHELLTHSP
jgi:hypothetical protein